MMSHELIATSRYVHTMKHLGSNDGEYAHRKIRCGADGNTDFGSLLRWLIMFGHGLTSDLRHACRCVRPRPSRNTATQDLVLSSRAQNSAVGLGQEKRECVVYPHRSRDEFIRLSGWIKGVTASRPLRVQRRVRDRSPSHPAIGNGVLWDTPCTKSQAK